MTIETLPATFEGQSLDIYSIHGERWMMANQIGLSLELTFPSIAINKICKRNADEFGHDDTMLVDLPDALGRMQPTRVFSHKGIVKIAMFAKTPKAAAFRDWAARVLTTPQMAMDGEVLAEVQKVWLAIKPHRDFVRYAQMALSSREIAKLTGWGHGTVFNRRKTAKALGLLPDDRPSAIARHVELKRIEA